MRAPMPRKSQGRPAEFSPFQVRVGVEVPQPRPQVGESGRRNAGDNTRRADPEYGCVDWYPYHDPHAAGIPQT